MKIQALKSHREKYVLGEFFKVPAKGRTHTPLLLLFTVALLCGAFKPQLCDCLFLFPYCDKLVIDRLQWDGYIQGIIREETIVMLWLKGVGGAQEVRVGRYTVVLI